MTPLAIAAMIVQLATKIIELRIIHYQHNPELAKQDADNAALLGAWGQKLLTAVERLFDALDSE